MELVAPNAMVLAVVFCDACETFPLVAERQHQIKSAAPDAWVAPTTPILPPNSAQKIDLLQT
jgi:hypothetical protein